MPGLLSQANDTVGIPVVRGLVPVGGGELWYEISGQGDPTVVLLHSGLLTSDMWDTQFDLLRALCRVVRYDARGHGRSTVPNNDFSHFMDLHQVIEHLQLGRPMLVGLSLGARTAVDLSLTFPDQLSCQLLVSPGLSGWHFRDPTLDGPRARLRVAREEGRWEQAASEFAEMWIYGPTRSAGQAPLVLRRRLEATIADALRRTAATQGTVREVGAAQRLSDIYVRSTVVTGGLDSQDIWEIAEAIAAASPEHRHLKVPNAGHLLNIEAAAAFDAILLNCVAEAGDLQGPRHL